MIIFLQISYSTVGHLAYRVFFAFNYRNQLCWCLGKDKSLYSGRYLYKKSEWPVDIPLSEVYSEDANNALLPSIIQNNKWNDFGCKKIRFNSNGASWGIIEVVLGKHNHTPRPTPSRGNPSAFLFLCGREWTSAEFFWKFFHPFQTFPDTRSLYLQWSDQIAQVNLC